MDEIIEAIRNEFSEGSEFGRRGEGLLVTRRDPSPGRPNRRAPEIVITFDNRIFRELATFDAAGKRGLLDDVRQQVRQRMDAYPNGDGIGVLQFRIEIA